MTAQVTINPYLTTNAVGSFNVTSVGYVQGMAEADPSARFALSAGVLASTETLPMWGGVGISEGIPGASGLPAAVLGGPIIRATSIGTTGLAGQLTGFSVFDQNFAAVNSPQSEVPLVGSGGPVTLYRLGSGARVPVAAAASLVSTEGSIITDKFSWDFINQELVPYTPAYVANPITGAVWANTGGGQTTFTVTNDLSAVLAAGSIIDVSGVVSTGGSGVGFNGNFAVLSVTSTTIVVSQPLGTSPGTYSSGGSVAPGGGALPVKLLDFNFGNSMVVNYNASNGFANWNRSGNTALLLLNSPSA